MLIVAPGAAASQPIDWSKWLTSTAETPWASKKLCSSPVARFSWARSPGRPPPWPSWKLSKASSARLPLGAAAGAEPPLPVSPGSAPAETLLGAPAAALVKRSWLASAAGSLRGGAPREPAAWPRMRFVLLLIAAICRCSWRAAWTAESVRSWVVSMPVTHADSFTAPTGSRHAIDVPKMAHATCHVTELVLALRGGTDLRAAR